MLLLLKEFFQHFADGLGQQGLGGLLNPNEAGALARDIHGIDGIALVVENIKMDFDSVRTEAPSGGAVFPVENFRNDDVVKLLELGVVDVVDRDCIGNKGDVGGVMLQLLCQNLDELLCGIEVNIFFELAVFRSDYKDPGTRFHGTWLL